ncbi:Rossmann-like and DUF2520 domain-containing protein [Legionella fallonii]|uniref:DUF2520 domain-containing protein n=1 Tax=Legionella fallonii LLAP-10 TaxID=1212491 RepID=A0A098G9P9_9GAMM|nr:Rossmann-like and DUF2520 domain-containing protein [Legionella fallonii]CEG59209.1 conserved protein of unknown function [Rossmann-like] [Legionella fallonii LLAP-10]
MTLLVNIIGAGHLGKTIGHLLVKNKLVKIGSICNRSETSSINAIKFIGQGKYCPTINELPHADITFITTPDDLISVTCEELSKNKFIKKGSVVLHCSGSITSDALISVKERGCYVASVHPMRSFAKPELSVEQYAGTYCAIEGDKEAFPYVHSLFNSIGSITYEIDKIKKSSYHAAGVFASNYLVTLAQQALSCMKEAGVENEMAMHVITNIMRGTVSNLEKTLSPEQSLTGPIKRGDISTIMKHIESLTDVEQKHLYSTLGKATLHLTDHNTVKKDKITNALAVRDEDLLNNSIPFFKSRL